MQNIFTLSLVISLTICNAETISGCGGTCTCNAAFANETCIFDCSTADSCKDATLECGEGDICIVDCSGDSGCSGNAQIIGTDAIDVIVFCSNEDSCKGNTNILCGTGVCQVTCSNSTSCEDATINAATAAEFSCSPVENCNAAYFVGLGDVALFGRKTDDNMDEAAQGNGNGDTEHIVISFSDNVMINIWAL
eukprot:UN08084